MFYIKTGVEDTCEQHSASQFLYSRIHERSEVVSMSPGKSIRDRSHHVMQNIK